MAQTGFTPIQLYFSSTTTNVPLAANLAGGELAINITDGKLFYKDNANAVQVIGWKVVPATAGGTGQTSFAVGDLLYADTTTTLAKLPDVATGNALISGGVTTAPSWGKIGLTTHVSGTLPTANGGTNLTSFTANGVVYASSSSVLATGSDLVFDGTNLGIAQTAPTSNGVSGYTNLVIGNSASTAAGITFRTTNAGTPVPGIVFARATGGSNGFVKYDQSIDALTFGSAGSERARIDDTGRFLFNTTGVPNGTSVYGSAFVPVSFDRSRLAIACSSTSSLELVQFFNPNGQVGSISTSGSATAYTTSSDYRLKNSITPMTGALAKVAQFKPVTYKWNSDDSDGEGFIAHELAEVCPNAVSGEKDGVETYTDDDGNEQTRPKYQGIDVSFLVATLTAAIQEQQSIIEQLQADVAALKGN
jgi:hypothetical protein